VKILDYVVYKCCFNIKSEHLIL